jgi:hypothetical protein
LRRIATFVRPENFRGFRRRQPLQSSTDRLPRRIEKEVADASSEVGLGLIAARELEHITIT